MATYYSDHKKLVGVDEHPDVIRQNCSLYKLSVNINDDIFGENIVKLFLPILFLLREMLFARLCTSSFATKYVVDWGSSAPYSAKHYKKDKNQ